MTRLPRAPEAPLPELADFLAPSNCENALIKLDTHTKPGRPANSYNPLRLSAQAVRWGPPRRAGEEAQMMPVTASGLTDRVRAVRWRRGSSSFAGC
jgi:hypothetical protein